MEEEALQESPAPGKAKAIVVGLLKVGISFGLVGYLIYRAASNQAFAELAERPKSWGFLVGATLIAGIAVVMTHIRWMWLVRTLDLPLACMQAVRIGSWGYLVNMMPLGIVGGDLVKAWMLSQQLGGHRAKAMASVIVDRVLGLYTLFVMGSVAIWLTGFGDLSPTLHTLSMAVYVVSIGATVGIAGLFVLWRSSQALMHRVERIPRVGPSLHNLITAFHMYQQDIPALLVALLMTLVLQSLFVASFWWLAMGLYDVAVPLPSQFVVVPVGSLTGVIPVPMGPFELALDFLYGALESPAHQGLMVALAYRVVCVLVAAAGVIYYLLTKAPPIQDSPSDV